MQLSNDRKASLSSGRFPNHTSNSRRSGRAERAGNITSARHPILYSSLRRRIRSSQMGIPSPSPRAHMAGEENNDGFRAAVDLASEEA